MQKLKKCIIHIVFVFTLLLSYCTAFSSLGDEDPIAIEDQKLHMLFKENKRTVNELAATIAGNAWAFNSFMEETLTLLKNEAQENLLRGTLRGIAFLLKGNIFEADLYYPEFKEHLEKLSTHTIASVRQTACIVRAILLRNSEKYTTSKASLFEETEALLREGKTSDFPFVRYRSYSTLVQTAEKCRNRDLAYSVAQEAFSALPDSYELKLHMILANLSSPDRSSEKDYVIHRRFSAEVLRKEGNPKQKVKAMFILALSYRDPALEKTEFYAPAKTAEIHNALYKMCLAEHSKFNEDGLIQDINSFDYLTTLSKLAYFYQYHSGHETDIFRAIDIYKILKNYPQYETSSFTNLIHIYNMLQSNPQYEESSFESLIDIYRRGPITIRSLLTALDMWKRRLASAKGPAHYLQLLQKISEFCQNTGFYGEESFYRLQLVSLLKGQPEHQLWELELALQASCRIYAIPERFLEIRNLALSFLNAGLNPPLHIKILSILSEVYKRYPSFASPSEISDIYNEITGPMLAPYVEDSSAGKDIEEILDDDVIDLVNWNN